MSILTDFTRLGERHLRLMNLCPKFSGVFDSTMDFYGQGTILRLDYAGRSLLHGIHESLRKLASEYPLETSADGSVREAFRYSTQSNGAALVEIVNLAPPGEVVHGFLADPRDAKSADNFARCRQATRSLDTDWDAAREERRTSKLFGYHELRLIDPGVNLPMDIIGAAGGTTWASCEGHPDGAYISWVGGDPAIADAFASCGWSVGDYRSQEAGMAGGIIAKMEGVTTVEDRDNRWRETCEALSHALALSAPGMAP